MGCHRTRKKRYTSLSQNKHYTNNTISTGVIVIIVRSSGQGLIGSGFQFISIFPQVHQHSVVYSIDVLFHFRRVL